MRRECILAGMLVAALALGVVAVPGTAVGFYPLATIDSGDYNGDGVSDIAIFRPSTGLWAVRDITRVYWGQAGDIPVPADYSGDGTTDIAVYRDGQWLIRGAWGGAMSKHYFGLITDIPVPGDYSGDGTAEIVIFRPMASESGSMWVFQATGDRIYFGQPGDIPAPMYIDGEKEIAIFRPATGLWAIRDGARLYFGTDGDIPVPGYYIPPPFADPTALKYIRSVNDQATIFRPGNGMWAVQEYAPDARDYFGQYGDQPVPGNYDGYEPADLAIFRDSNGLWAISGEDDSVTRLYFGREDDIAVSGMAINPSAAIEIPE